MQIKPEKLTQENANKNLYLIYGEETLLVDTSISFIRKTAQNNGFNERLRFDIDVFFDWSILYQELQSMSLFSAKKIIECYLNISSQNSAHIIEFAQNISNDIVLIFIVNDINKSQKNNKWFKTIDTNGIIIAHYILQEQQTKAWIVNKAKQMHLSVDNRVINTILFHNEGNLLAVWQELQKLQMVYGQDHIDYDSYDAQIEQQSHYKPYSLINAAMLGDSIKMIKIQQTLEYNGVAALYIINILINELKTISKIAIDAKKSNVISALQKYHFWRDKENMLKLVLQRNNIAQIQKIIITLGKIERTVKGYGVDDVWSSLLKLLLNLSGKKIWIK